MALIFKRHRHVHAFTYKKPQYLTDGVNYQTTSTCTCFHL